MTLHKMSFWIESVPPNVTFSLLKIELAQQNHARNGLEFLVLCERLIFCESVLKTNIQIIFNLRITITFIISCRDFNYWCDEREFIIS